MKVFFGIVVAMSLAIGAGLWSEKAFSWASTASDVAVQRNASDVYRTAAVAIGRIRPTITATGSLQAVATVEVSSQLSGQIARLDADFNDTVVTGQPLAELDQRGFRARVVQAEAEFEMARENVAILTAKLEKARGMARETSARRKAFRARLDQAWVKLNAAKRKFARTEKLAKRGTASASSVEDARADRDTAAAELREAKAAGEAHEHVVASSNAGLREAEAELANARAALPLRQAAVALARLDLERSTIRAPIDGVIVGRNVEQGQTVAASLDAPVLFTIAGDLSEMEIHAKIDETDIAEIAAGQAAEFTIDAFPGRTFSAKVSEIRKAALVVQGVVTYTVVLSASNPQGLLLPGMTATVRIAVDDVGPVRTVPLAALRFAPKNRVATDPTGKRADTNAPDQTVWVLNRNGNPEPRRLRLGADDGREVAVLDGALSKGERVITGRVPSPARFRLFGVRF